MREILIDMVYEFSLHLPKIIIYSQTFATNSVIVNSPPSHFRSILYFISVLPGILSSGIYLFKVKNGNTKMMCEICSKLAILIKMLDDANKRRSGNSIVNFEQI